MNILYRVATVRENILEIKKNSGQGKVREFHFQSGKSRKNEQSHGKFRENQSFLKKKLLVNGLLEILFSIIASNIRNGMFMIINYKAIYVQKHPFSNIYGLRFFIK